MSGFVDTNIFVRLLTGDDPTKARRSRDLLQSAQRGDVSLVTSEMVVAEIIYVLTRATYRLPRSDVADAVRSILANPGLHVDHKRSVVAAVESWGASSLDFEDWLSIEQVRRASLDGIYSYDRDFDRVPGVRRFEP